jgi:hypothetical protein
MPDITRGILFLGLAIAGWMVSKHSGEFARISMRAAPMIAGVFTCCLALTGFFRTVGLNAETHRWTGHALVIYLWLYVPFAIGYLGPTSSDPLSEESYRRFEILHEYFLPGIFFALLVESWWFFRPRRPAAQPNT